MAHLISDTLANSSTPPPIFSDNATRPSTPPSSPPCLPWDQKPSPDTDTVPEMPEKSLTPPPKTAFSLLGKRKPLDSVVNSARPTKKPVRSHFKTEKKQPLTQMQISLGQRVQTTCVVCGMEYVASSAEDRKLHDTFHRQHTEGFDVGKDFAQKARDAKAAFDAGKGGTICAVDCFDAPARKKRAHAVLELAQKDLGAVAIDDKELWSQKTFDSTGREGPRYTSYMYVRGTKCIGYLLGERIAKAYPVVAPKIEKKPVSVPTQAAGGSALAILRARKQAEAEAEALAKVEQEKADDRPIELSKTASRAYLGIARIWTSPKHRRQNIATALLDAACVHHNLMTRDDIKTEGSGGLDSERRRKAMNRVAFSQPTALGTKLARRWTGMRGGWLVYVD